VVASAWVQTANVVLAIFAPVWVNEGKAMLPIYCSSLCGGGSLRKGHAARPAQRIRYAIWAKETYGTDKKCSDVPFWFIETPANPYAHA